MYVVNLQKVLKPNIHTIEVGLVHIIITMLLLYACILSRLMLKKRCEPNSFSLIKLNFKNLPNLQKQFNKTS